TRARGGGGRAVPAATLGPRREDRPDPRYVRSRHAQHRHARRRAVDLPEHEPVANAVRGVDELFAPVVADWAERFLEEQSHPLHEQAAVVGGGESRRTGHTTPSPQPPPPTQ